MVWAKSSPAIFDPRRLEKQMSGHPGLEQARGLPKKFVAIATEKVAANLRPEHSMNQARTNFDPLSNQGSAPNALPLAYRGPRPVARH